MGFEYKGAAAAALLEPVEPDFSEFIGSSSAMKGIYHTISCLLDNDSTALILGDSGSGKELVARAIHKNSLRGNKNMVIVNCGAIPEELLESELFGHEKGAFTGAIRDRKGCFEMAHQGTIFLDEIGDMSPKLQVKLLRVLQEQEFEKVGGARSVKVDVRVIAATNIDLEKAVELGNFREDLYYRLNVIPVELPPLRERGDDIALLVGHFIKKFNKKLKRNVRGISPEALRILLNHKWPGNVRELKHMVERICIMKGRGMIEKADLPPKLRNIEIAEDKQLLHDMLIVSGPEDLKELGLDEIAISHNEEASRREISSEEILSDQEPQMEEIDASGWKNTGVAPPVLPHDGIKLKEAVDKYETALIVAALERCGWVKNKAAALLGLNRTTLVEKLKKKDILNGLKPDKVV